MKKVFLFLLAAGLFTACNQIMEEGNPLLKEFNTPHGVPPFSEIKPEHFIPAYQTAIDEHNKEIAAIVDEEEAPTFKNTLVALDNSGMLLDKVSSVFDNLTSSETSDKLQKIAKEVSPMLSKHSDDIKLNAKLFDRIKTVYEQKDEIDLNREQTMLLEKTYKNFVRGGANLPEDKKARLRKINSELSLLSLNFGDNLLAETNNYQLVIEDEANLAGLPETVLAGAKETAEAEGMDGKWIFTLQKPSMIPFLQYAENRDLREEIYKAYLNRGNNNNEYDNKDLIKKMVNLRVEKAHLLGYEAHADFVLEKNMANTPEKVFDFLYDLWTPALERAKQERAMMQEMIDEEGHDFQLASWDWWYYAEKIKKAKYDLSEDELRPYFELEASLNGMLDVANKLFGITFEEKDDIPVYHKDVRAFEVYESNGELIGVLYMDFFPRASKRGGAWMNAYRKQSRRNGKNIRLIITTNFNFTKPTGDKPALLSIDEYSTLYHEFGHALHGLLSDCTYHKLSGTSVPRDFVELPSQIMENWANHPKVMESYAKHFETGETIPSELLSKIKKSGLFNQGFATVEYLAASILDMKYHALREQKEIDVLEFEDKVLNEIGLIPEIESRYRSTYFAHIFSGGYSAGYYSYIWAAVLDADAFAYFKETNIFDEGKAQSFRENILSKGGTLPPMEMYKNFRGQEPSPEPLLERRGLK